MRELSAVKRVTAVCAAGLAVVVTGVSASASSSALAPLPSLCLKKPRPVGVFRFSGNGTKEIAPFRLRKGSTLHWRAAPISAGAGFFSLTDRSYEWIGVTSQAKKGTSYIPAGSYRLSVIAGAGWTFCIAPRR
jgi:hypothetical protein